MFFFCCERKIFLFSMTKLSLTTQQSLSFQASVLSISSGNVPSVLDSNALGGPPSTSNVDLHFSKRVIYET